MPSASRKRRRCGALTIRSKKIVIVRDDIEPRYDEKGIFYIGVRDFLLSEDLLER